MAAAAATDYFLPKHSIRVVIDCYNGSFVLLARRNLANLCLIRTWFEIEKAVIGMLRMYKYPFYDYPNTRP